MKNSLQIAAAAGLLLGTLSIATFQISPVQAQAATQVNCELVFKGKTKINAPCERLPQEPNANSFAISSKTAAGEFVGIVVVDDTRKVANLRYLENGTEYNFQGAREGDGSDTSKGYGCWSHWVTNSEAKFEQTGLKEEQTIKICSRAFTYSKMTFGFNTCNASFGELHKNVTEDDMLKKASLVNSKGFSYHPTLKYGKVLIGDYPLDCKSPASESWPLYLRSDQAPGV